MSTAVKDKLPKNLQKIRKELMWSPGGLGGPDDFDYLTGPDAPQSKGFQETMRALSDKLSNANAELWRLRRMKVPQAAVAQREWLFDLDWACAVFNFLWGKVNRFAARFGFDVEFLSLDYDWND